MTPIVSKFDRRTVMESEAGFTLVELLIVIVVLGILAAVVVFSLGTVTSKSAVTACQADGATVNTAIVAYNTNNGAYATSPAQLTSTASGGPYLLSWPSNFAHYTFAIDASGNLWLQAGTTQVVTAPTVLNGWTPWTGPPSCGASGANVS